MAGGDRTSRWLTPASSMVVRNVWRSMCGCVERTDASPETSTAANVRFYTRLGSAVSREIDLAPSGNVDVDLRDRRP